MCTMATLKLFETPKALVVPSLKIIKQCCLRSLALHEQQVSTDPETE